MIFPKFEGKVWGIWDNGHNAWSVDYHGNLIAGTQKEIVDAQCVGMPGNYPVFKASDGSEHPCMYEVKEIADYTKLPVVH